MSRTESTTLVFDEATIQAISVAVAQAVIGALGTVTQGVEPTKSARRSTTPKGGTSSTPKGCVAVVLSGANGQVQRPCKGRWVEDLQGKALCSTHRRKATGGGSLWIDGDLVTLKAQPKAATTKATTTKATKGTAPKGRSEKPLSKAEGDPSVNTKIEVTLDAGYYVTEGQDDRLRSYFGLPKAGPSDQLLTMSEVVRLCQDYNGESRGNGSTHRVWADFRMVGSKNRLTAHQVRYILRNGSLRGWKKP